MDLDVQIVGIITQDLVVYVQDVVNRYGSI